MGGGPQQPGVLRARLQRRGAEPGGPGGSAQRHSAPGGRPQPRGLPRAGGAAGAAGPGAGRAAAAFRGGGAGMGGD